jgi:hypothetical protein
LIQCFDIGDNLPLVDKLDVGQPIGSVAWSCSYDKLAIGTRNGAIVMVDPMKLEGNGTMLVSDHHFSDIIGIDVVGPGLQYFVVSASCFNLTSICPPAIMFHSNNRAVDVMASWKSGILIKY